MPLPIVFSISSSHKPTFDQGDCKEKDLETPREIRVFDSTTRTFKGQEIRLTIRPEIDAESKAKRDSLISDWTRPFRFT